MNAPQPVLDPAPKQERTALAVVMALVAVVAVVSVGFAVIVRSTLEDNASVDRSAAPSTDLATTIGESSLWIAPPAGTANTSAPSSSSVPSFGYQPLWPFADVAQAQEWQEQYAEGGHQPWHLDADQVALTFTQYFLGFTNVDTVVHQRAAGRQMWVTVGFANPRGDLIESAELHLVRMGTGDSAPWEVVGTEDDTLTVTTPRYGARVTSPVQVGGRITGVDESLTVQVLSRNEPHVAGVVSGVSAGGEKSPWSVSVPFSTAPDQTLIVVVSTGGHIASVERFAVTAVRY